MKSWSTTRSATWSICKPADMKFLVDGGRPLKGRVRASGSKNAALPIIAAALLSDREFVLENVPDIGDIRTLLNIMEFLGSQYSFSGNTLRIRTPEIRTTDIPLDMVKTMRASILLIGPLLARAGHIRIGYPGGCVLGKRPIDTHLDAFRALGVKVSEADEMLEMNGEDASSGKVVLKEISVTASENLIMLAAGLKGITEIRLAAQEPHVQDLCRFLSSAGVRIEGIGSHILTVYGGSPLVGAEHRIRPDYLEVGTLAIAAAATQGDVTIEDMEQHDLDALWQKLSEAGVILDFDKQSVRVRGVKRLDPIAKLDTGIFPKFPTDLQSPFMVMMTQAHGVSKVFETLFEGRLNYLFELEKMGAKFEFLNPHQAIIIGPTPLRAASIASCDIRAGAGMLVAALMAKGLSEITSINYIDRGYEHLDEKLRSLGASIKRSVPVPVHENSHRSLNDQAGLSTPVELQPSVPVKL
ncbi:MAG: UDP-N-acetylglucosamine 1-carboxyvinyltransferase [bacterium]|nr:UDP-N-acetylglucosamine 1-carboxyvinyltransferase [bacterium]